MKKLDTITIIELIVSIGLFVFGLKLFIDASQPCGSDGCLIHLLYFGAIPILIISGVFGYRTIKKILENSRD